MKLANDTIYGSPAGFYVDPSGIDWFVDPIQAGVLYATLPLGSTAGAWPGFQPFGGWKGSGSSGRNADGLYYLPLYLHDQIRNTVRRA